MCSDFSSIIKLLKNNNFTDFEKEIKKYISAKNEYNPDEYAKNYIILKKLLVEKFIEFKEDKKIFPKIFNYIQIYLNKNDYDNYTFWYKTGTYFKNLELNKIALKCYLKCLNFKNIDYDLYRILGDIYYFDKNEYEKSLKCYEKYIEYEKNNDSVYNMLGHLYETLYKSEFVDKQISYFEKAHNLYPFDKEYLKNLCLVTGKNRDVKRFCKYSNLIIKNNPSHQDKFDFACWSLYNKLFKNMHKYYYNRFFLENTPTEYPNINEKLWNGKDIIKKDKTLLVRYEQGFGDSVCFVRLLPMLQKIIPNFIFEVQDELVSLLQYNYPNIKIFSDNTENNIKYDYQIPLLNLISILKITDKNIPQKDGYLSVSEEKTKEFAKNNLKTEKIKIGIAFKGNMDYKGDNRDIPEELWIKLTNIKNIQVYSLQIENKEHLFELPESKDIIDLSSVLTDFEQTACAMKNMDLIISTDNVILNLAGAMGLKTFGLFNYYTDFRWFTLNGNDTGWYNSIKVYQTHSYNAWQELFKKVINDVKKLAK